MHGPRPFIIARSGQRVSGAARPSASARRRGTPQFRAGERPNSLRSAGRPDRQGLQQWHGRSLQQRTLRKVEFRALPGRSAI